MKKLMLLVTFTIAVSFYSTAQNVWNGTSVPSTTTAKVGAVTNSPTAQLHVTTSNALPATWNTGLKIENFGNDTYGDYFSISNQFSLTPPVAPLKIFSVSYDYTYIYNKLRIGEEAANGAYSGYTLSVDGDMIAKRCVIQVSDWADYVFNDNYEMPTLGDLEKFINNNKHLPGVPSTDEALKNGVEVGDMNKILLQKVEELTLYMIDLQKQNEALKSRIDNLEHK